MMMVQKLAASKVSLKVHMMVVLLEYKKVG
jgi:hypothetical protein